MATATANHHQWQINLHKLQSQSLDLQQILNPKTSTKKKRKRKRNSKSSTNIVDPLQSQTSPPTTTTNIAGPKLNQPPPQPPAQNPNPTDQSMTQNPHIETHPKYHTHEPIKRSKGSRQGLWRSTVGVVEVDGEVRQREILSKDESNLEQGGLRGKR